MKTPQNTPRATGNDAHTPYSIHQKSGQPPHLLDAAGNRVATFNDSHIYVTAHSAFIVRACNSHAEREELLRWFMDACESGELKPRDNDAASVRAFNRRVELTRAALALAKEGRP